MWNTVWIIKSKWMSLEIEMKCLKRESKHCGLHVDRIWKSGSNAHLTTYVDIDIAYFLY